MQVNLSTENVEQAKQRINELVEKAAAGEAAWTPYSATGFLYGILLDDLKGEFDA